MRHAAWPDRPSLRGAVARYLRMIRSSLSRDNHVAHQVGSWMALLDFLHSAPSVSCSPRSAATTSCCLIRRCNKTVHYDYVPKRLATYDGSPCVPWLDDRAHAWSIVVAAIARCNEVMNACRGGVPAGELTCQLQKVQVIGGATDFCSS